MAKFQTAFGSHRVVNLNQDGEVTMTHQSFQDECDINLILAKFERTGLLEHVQKTQGNYGDFMFAEDFQSSLHRISEAKEAFADLPSKVRRRFDNDPVMFLDFVQNPSNREEMIQLGLIDVQSEKSSSVQIASELSGGNE